MTHCWLESIHKMEQIPKYEVCIKYRFSFLFPTILSFSPGTLTEEGADKENIEIVKDLPPEEASADKGDPSCEPKDTVDGNENLSSVVTQPLNEEVLKILGKDLASPPDPEQNMHPDLASRWRFVLSKGLLKEVKKEFSINTPERYLLSRGPGVKPRDKSLAK